MLSAFDSVWSFVWKAKQSYRWDADVNIKIRRINVNKTALDKNYIDIAAADDL